MQLCERFLESPLAIIARKPPKRSIKSNQVKPNKAILEDANLLRIQTNLLQGLLNNHVLARRYHRQNVWCMLVSIYTARIASGYGGRR